MANNCVHSERVPAVTKSLLIDFSLANHLLAFKNMIQALVSDADVMSTNK